MNETCRRYGPVAASVGIIILIAVLRERSKVLAAITATMPVNITLALWLMYAAEQTSQADLIDFIRSMAVGVVGTLFWLLTVWAAARAGWGLGRLILLGYSAWGVLLGAVVLMQLVLGGPKFLAF